MSVQKDWELEHSSIVYVVDGGDVELAARGRDM